MPELAEVFYFSKQWLPLGDAPVMVRRMNHTSRVFRECGAQAMADALTGRGLTLAATHGKQMVFRFGADAWLGVHLGMAGKLHFQPAGYAPEKHDHLILANDSGCAVFTDYRHFGRIRFSMESSAEGPAWWHSLPPDVRSPEFTEERMAAALLRHGKAPVKAVLLDQAYFPGLGNWMVDEILWRGRVHPATPAGRIGSAVRLRLFDVIREVVSDALRVIGSNWGDPPDDWLFNHRWRDGGTCPATGKALRRRTIGGRTTCWSPTWQTYRGTSATKAP